jgi:hypothetical protein
MRGSHPRQTAGRFSLYNMDSLKLLSRIVGLDRYVFGTERPGGGSKTDPRTGKWHDDARPKIESIPWFTAEDTGKIFK